MADHAGRSVFAAPFPDARGNRQPGLVLTAYVAGTNTLATLYADRDKTPGDNPFTTDSLGNAWPMADPGDYELTVGDSPERLPFTVINDPGDLEQAVLDLLDHLDDATAAHAASAVSFAPVGNVVATDVQAAVAELDAQDTAEATTRAAADAGLAGSITTEAAARGAADTALSDDLADEAATRLAADSGEAATRAAADAALASDLADETAAREAADAALGSGWAADLADEVAAREAADSAEATQRENADTNLGADIDTERAARIAADDDEADARTLADEVEAAARATADTAETNARVAADAQLLDALNDEVADRAAADATEAAARAAADTAHLNDDTDAHDATAVSFVPTGSIASTNVQSAVAEVATDAAAALAGHAGGSPAHQALDVAFIPAGSVAATNVQDAIAEVASEGAAALAAHLNDAVDAHDASAISVVAGGSLSSTDVQAALLELDAQDTTDAAALAAHLGDTTDAHDASAISVTPTGGLAATDVQGALAELDTQAAAEEAARTAANVVLGDRINDEVADRAAADATEAAARAAADQDEADAREAADAAEAAARAAADAAHLGDTTDAHDASAVSFSPAGSIASTDVQAAIVEVASDAASGLGDHLGDSVDAHDASAVSFAPSGSVAATDVQAAVLEVAADAASALGDHISDASAAHAASAVSFVPTGGIAATDVQGAVAELDTEKVATTARAVNLFVIPATSAANTAAINSVAINAAIASAAGRTVYVLPDPAGTIQHDTAITIPAGVSYIEDSRAQLRFTGTGPALIVDSWGVQDGGKVALGHRQPSALGWVSGADTTTVGVQIKNCNHALVELGRVEYFYIGLEFVGDGTGCVGNEVHGAFRIASCKLGIKNTTLNGGWVNDNHIHDGGVRIDGALGWASTTSTGSHVFPGATTVNVASTAGFTSSGKANFGSHHFTYTGTTPTSFTGVTIRTGSYAGTLTAGTAVTQVVPGTRYVDWSVGNGNTLYSVLLEGSTPEETIRFGGSRNRVADCRLEDTQLVRFLTGAQENEVDGGYGNFGPGTHFFQFDTLTDANKVRGHRGEVSYGDSASGGFNGGWAAYEGIPMGGAGDVMYRTRSTTGQTTSEVLAGGQRRLFIAGESYPRVADMSSGHLGYGGISFGRGNVDPDAYFGRVAGNTPALKANCTIVPNVTTVVGSGGLNISSTAEVYRLNLTANIGVAFNAAAEDGQRLQVEILQDATGGRTINWAFTTNVNWLGGTAPPLALAANAMTIIGLSWRADLVKWVEVYRGYSAAPFSTKTANYALIGGPADQVVAFNGSSLTATLPSAATVLPGQRYTIKNLHSSALTIATTSGQTIDGAAPGTLAQWRSLTVVSDGANWLTVTANEAVFVATTGAQTIAGAKTFTDDVELSTASTGVILKSPSGNRFRLTVEDDGVLTTTGPL